MKYHSRFTQRVRVNLVLIALALFSANTFGKGNIETRYLPDTAARRSWSALLERYAQLSKAGYFDEFVIEHVRTPNGRTLARALDNNPAIAQIRPILNQGLSRQADYLIAKFLNEAPRLSQHIEPSLHRAALAAIRRQGLYHPIDPKNIYIFRMNSGGEADAAMFTSKSAGGKMVMLLFDGLDQLVDDVWQFESVVGHEATHFTADHIRMTEEILISYLYLGEEALERELKALLSQLEELEKQFSRTNSTKRQARLFEKIQKQKKQIVGMKLAHAEHREELYEFVREESLKSRLMRASKEIDVAALMGMDESSSLPRHIEEAKNTLKRLKAKNGGKVIRAQLAEIFAALAPAKAEAKALRAAITKGISFGDLSKLEAVLERASRAFETTSDRGGVLSTRFADPLHSMKIEYYLSAGKGYRGKKVTAEALEEWIRQPMDAYLRTAQDIEIRGAIDATEGTHPYGPARAELARRFARSPDGLVLRDYFQRHVAFYLQKKAELLGLNQHLVAHENGLPSAFTGAEASQIARQVHIGRLVETVLEDLESRIIDLVKTYGRGKGFTRTDNRFFKQLLLSTKTAPEEVTTDLLKRLRNTLIETKKNIRGGNGENKAITAIDEKIRNIDATAVSARSRQVNLNELALRLQSGEAPRVARAQVNTTRTRSLYEQIKRSPNLSADLRLIEQQIGKMGVRGVLRSFEAEWIQTRLKPELFAKQFVERHRLPSGLQRSLTAILNVARKAPLRR